MSTPGRQVKRKLQLPDPEDDDGTDSKQSRTGPASPASDGGAAESPRPTDGRGGRYDTSLGLLTKKFTALLRGAPDGVLDLNKAADQLRVPKRRIYDITNVLEGIGLIEKKSKNNIQWKGVGPSSNKDELGSQLDVLREELSALLREERTLDEHSELMQNSLRSLAEDAQNVRLAYVTHDDLRQIPSYRADTLITIKAPSGTTLEVPDPDEVCAETGKRKYQLILKSKSGAIEVYLVSRPEDAGVVAAAPIQDFQHGVDPQHAGVVDLLVHPTALASLAGSEEPKGMGNTGHLVRLDPPPMDTDYFFNLDECEGIADLYDFAADLSSHDSELHSQP